MPGLGRTAPDPALLTWLSSPENPPVQYLTARDLARPQPSPDVLDGLRRSMWSWEPLRRVLDLQNDDGSFGDPGDRSDARPTFWALSLMQRCGLDVSDPPVAAAVEHLDRIHRSTGPVSWTGDGSGVLPCYVGVVTTALLKMGAVDAELVRASIRWVVDHQRFDHKELRGGGAARWAYLAPASYGCWESVSCFHGVAGTFRMLAAIPPRRRTAAARDRLEEAIAYLRVHRLYKQTASGRPMFDHLLQPSLVDDHQSDLLDLLQGVADADPGLIRHGWVREAADEMEALTVDGKVPLVTDHGRAPIDPIPLEPIGAPSRFLTHQWLQIRAAFDAALVP